MIKNIIRFKNHNRYLINCNCILYMYDIYVIINTWKIQIIEQFGDYEYHNYIYTRARARARTHTHTHIYIYIYI